MTHAHPGWTTTAAGYLVPDDLDDAPELWTGEAQPTQPVGHNDLHIEYGTCLCDCPQCYCPACNTCICPDCDDQPEGQL